ncbi:hypothetical protein Ddye_018557 [Dipteronia dyeriana]|uniref:AMP-binding enzyme C-terminal domain-containing protein n=1 Tax=Dipteronia dyeriana TaxID=168575 RepID=A0AAD9UBG3_9ROSI|nr:hypothetical protein Ddye_018557 [Dipteronia dyeriana]
MVIRLHCYSSQLVLFDLINNKKFKHILFHIMYGLVVPAELEHLLLSNSDIVDAAVVPYPDEDAGQIPMAFVVRKHGTTITGTQVMDFIAKQVGLYKKIQRVVFIDSIPKSITGKILRRELVNYALFHTVTEL